MNNKAEYAYIFIIIFTLIASYILKIDISNGGATRDLYHHWNFITALNSNLGILLQKGIFVENPYPTHFPLHHIIISRFGFLSEDLGIYLNFYFLFSLFLPVIFYICMNNRFPEIEIRKKIYISSIIFFLPNYQAASIWGNSHITGLFFFLCSLYFLINLEKLKNKHVNLNIFLLVFFMACTVYTKQYYIIPTKPLNI